METQTHSSRIPVPISARQRERSRSPSADASTQTNGLGEEDRKKGISAKFLVPPLSLTFLFWR